ncbi:VOC family protein [Hoyosella rhizosphaerae]|uniref:VOC domain-containing protein n=1 Tax=Hoyosella rhizosphaerae TaxID=1755582 RepID=A0A916U1M1_9ACTN|nr:VOC family protein [Hoyosella rhizosphaerae]MBN4927010.1 VOC family protein [Hoyosella rhizosphaerae]GGC54746.1 hypothetical protein GCM10011410_03920 [Hoyosella rhizosphaerae]
MSIPTINSALLSSTNPERLRDFYAASFGIAPEATPDGGYHVITFGGFYLMFDSRDDVSDTAPEPGRIIFNIEVENAPTIAQRLTDNGARWLSPLENREGSWFGTAIDPDGNYVQIIEPSDEMRAMMSE